MGKNIGIISYNIYGNFTNYGSALQSWALSKSISKLGYNAVLVDYCPDFHLDKNILNPLEKMWDQDAVSRLNTELTLPAIKENYYKFEEFFTNKFNRTKKKYTAANFNEAINDVDSFVCGSDTIFCIDESNGFDDGFFANYDCMKNNSIAFSASFGDAEIIGEQRDILAQKLKNFKAIGLREKRMLDFVAQNAECKAKRTIDPTLLMKPEEYEEITAEKQLEEKYLILYTRRYNEKMQSYAEYLAKKHNWKIVEISLRATNADKGHIMRYDAGVEEFLSLVKHAEYVVTNSFHGLMFSVLFKKQFAIFSRETGNSKIKEALELFGLKDNLLIDYTEKELFIDDYENVHRKIDEARKESMEFLGESLRLL